MSESGPPITSTAATATGFSVIGRKLLTVTADNAHSDDSLIENLLKATFPRMNQDSGESLEDFAIRVADAAGLTVATWELSGA